MLSIAFNSYRKIGDKTLKHLAKTSLAAQIRTVFSARNRAELEKTGFSALTDELIKYACSPGPVVRHLSSYIPNLFALEHMEDTIRFARNVEPFIEDTRLVFIPGSRRIHLRQFDYGNTYVCSEEDGVVGCKINTCVGAGLIRWSDIEAFESLINRSDVTELDLQLFFEKHPRFLLGAQYQRLHSQVVLVNDDGQELIPDFFAERVGTSFADIIELKKPSEKLVVGPTNRRGLASSITRALNQVRVYRNYFDDANRRRLFHRHYGFEAFRPVITVVIGRSSDYLNHMERIVIEDEYRNLELLTYDDILLRAKQLAITI